MPYDKAAARRVLAGHLTNLYADDLDGAEFQRNVNGLASLALENGDQELHGMALALLAEIEAGRFPVVMFPMLGLTVSPPELEDVPELEELEPTPGTFVDGEGGDAPPAGDVPPRDGDPAGGDGPEAGDDPPADPPADGEGADREGAQP